jgi:hypothetical protein
MSWERATPVALMEYVITKKSATGVARSQQRASETLAVQKT